MRIGVPAEVKLSEYRVGLTPSVVEELVYAGHGVTVESRAGAGVGIGDESYVAAGATVAPDAATVFRDAELIIKVKEPQPDEVLRLTAKHILFTYLHLAADPLQAAGLRKSGCTAIAYETVRDRWGRLPLLAPMSQVAGRMAVDAGATAMLRPNGGRGLLMSGVPGVAPARVLILGGGVAGLHAAQMAVGRHADVTLFDLSLPRLEEIEAIFGGRVKTVYSTPSAIRAALSEADLVIGCVLLPGAAAPKLIRREDLARMKPGSVLVDVAIDQGGCFETSHATTHDDPTYVLDGIVHYCVANMPGAAPLTSTYALSAATAPYVRALADKGVDNAFADDPGFGEGLNVREGRITHPAVASALSRE